jgi:hypothetical protein
VRADANKRLNGGRSFEAPRSRGEDCPVKGGKKGGRGAENRRASAGKERKTRRGAAEIRKKSGKQRGARSGKERKIGAKRRKFAETLRFSGFY